MVNIANKTFENLAFSFLPPKQKYFYNITRDQIEKKSSNLIKKTYHYSAVFFKISMYLILVPFAVALSSLINLKNKPVAWLKSKYQLKPKTLSDNELSSQLIGKIDQKGRSASPLL